MNPLVLVYKVTFRSESINEKIISSLSLLQANLLRSKIVWCYPVHSLAVSGLIGSSNHFFKNQYSEHWLVMQK